MECNKDEAEKCFRIAKGHLRDGNTQQAIKFLLKAQNLFPTDESADLLAQVQSTNASSSPSSSRPPSPPLRPASTASSAASTASASASSRPTVTHGPRGEYSQDQLDAVASIKSKTDYYEILGITKTASADQIKKAYKLLALKFHPDKNRAPGASEAFRMVSEAYQCLSNERARSNYDRFGNANGPQASAPAPGEGYGYSEGSGFGPRFRYARYEPELSPEDLFNMFFGHMPMQGQRAHFRAQPAVSPALFPYMHLLPLLLILLWGIALTPSSDDSYFSLDPTSAFSVSRHSSTTSINEIPYFVKEDFYRRFGRDSRALYRIESSVEAAYLKKLQEECETQKRLRKSGIEDAKRVASATDRTFKLQQAYAQTLPSCETLKTISG